MKSEKRYLSVYVDKEFKDELVEFGRARGLKLKWLVITALTYYMQKRREAEERDRRNTDSDSDDPPNYSGNDQ